MARDHLDDRLDDYVDGELPATERAALDAHVADCAACRSAVERERALRALLADYGNSSEPLPDAAYFDAALDRAASEGRRQRRQRWLFTGLGGAVAATLAFLVVTSGQLGAPVSGQPPAEVAGGIPAVTMTLAEPRTVNLVFSADTALVDARLTIELPPGVELDGFPGRSSVSWRTSLAPGQNLLPLRLIASSPQGGELLATLEHGADGRAFRVRITVI